MLDAFIVDQLKKAEQRRSIEDQRPRLEIPCEPEEPPKRSKKSEEERGVWSIQF